MADLVQPAFAKAFETVKSSARHIAFAAGYVQGDGAPTLRSSGRRFRGGGAVGEDAAWHIGSISKTFTATLVMQMVEIGSLDLDVPISGYFADFAGEMHADWAAISLRSLLSHTAGLRPNFTNAQMTAVYSNDLAAERLSRLRALWGQPATGRKGAYAYSNLGYVLAGAILERVTGQPWEHLVTERIGKPLCLASMGTGAPRGADDPWGHRNMILYRKAMDPATRASDNPPWLGPAGTLHMSLSDLLRWGQAHLQAGKGERPDFLSRESCALMQSPVAASAGLGWQVAQFPGSNVDLVGHDGSNGMWLAHVSVLPQRNMVFAFAMNDGRMRHAYKSLLVFGKALLSAQPV